MTEFGRVKQVGSSMFLGSDTPHPKRSQRPQIFEDHIPTPMWFDLSRVSKKRQLWQVVVSTNMSHYSSKSTKASELYACHRKKRNK